MSAPPSLFVDIGSTTVKTCLGWDADRFTLVRSVPRQVGIAPGDQVATLVERERRGGPLGPVRVCSSANGGVRVGIIGLSQRHSVAAAGRAVLDGGGTVVYQRTLAEVGPPQAAEPAAPDVTEPATPTAPQAAEPAAPAAPEPASPQPPAVDLLVLVGGVDGGDPRRLRAALSRLRLAEHPHRLLVWAGAEAPELTAALPPHRRASNVLDRELRARPAGLTALVRAVYLDDLVDAKGLGALRAVTETAIWPTPAVVGLAAELLPHRLLPLAPTTPFLVVDVGGATTDVFACGELRDSPGARPAPGESLLRQVFPDLGVASAAPRLLRLLAADPELVDLVTAVAPERSRALYHAVYDRDPAALAPPVGFLACLYLALRRVAEPGQRDRLATARAASLVITGGAWRSCPPAAIHRVVAAARGTVATPASVLLDHRYALWAHGIQRVPTRAGPAAAEPDGERPTAGGSGERPTAGGRRPVAGGERAVVNGQW